MATGTMKALVAYSKDEYRLETAYPIPTVGPEDLLIKVEACGVCAGDVKGWHGAPKFWGDEKSASWVKAPFIPGHEFIGEVIEVGPNYKGDIKLGDRVAPEQIVPCGECKFCRTGRYWMCQKHDIFGFQTNVNGGMAEYALLPKEARVYKVPKDMSMEKAILVEPYSCAKHAVDRAQITNEDVVVLSGAGPLGIGMLGCIKLRSPKCLIVLDLKEDRLELAKKFGADFVMNPAKEDVVAKVREMTDGYGCDIYIEATGAPPSVVQGLNMIRKLGRFVEFSVFGAETTVDWSIIGDSKELDLLGAHLSPYSFDVVLDWIEAGKLPTENVVTHTFKLDDWEKSSKLNDAGEGSMKVVLIP